MKKYILIPIILMIVVFVEGFPMVPSTFYGDLKIDNEFAPSKTIVELYTDDGISCGRVVTEKNGEYVVSCDKYSEKLKMEVNRRIVEEEFFWKEGGFERRDVNIILAREEIPTYRNSNIDLMLIMAFMVIIVFVMVRVRNGKE